MTNILTLDAAEAAIQKINHRKYVTRLDQLTYTPFIDGQGEVHVEVKNEEGRVMTATAVAEKQILRSMGIGQRLLQASK
ncbi:MAG: hypothetical protein E6R03_09130, partial [Hyphomicrobiaceae bacterium]